MRRTALLVAGLVMLTIAGIYRAKAIRTAYKSRVIDAEKLAKALESGELETVTRFLSQGGSPNIRLHDPSIANSLIGILKLSDSIENDPPDCVTYTQNTSESGFTPLMVAAHCGDEPIVAKLLSAGADVNATSQDGATALMQAAVFNHTEIVQALLSKGAHIEAQTNKGQTALMFASWVEWGPRKADKYPFNDAEHIELLLRAGADINARDTAGNTPLIGAAGLRHTTNALQRLLSAGADIHAQNNEGRNALMNAAKRASVEMVNQLLSQGANIHTKDNNGATALHYAKAVDNLRTLLDHGASLNAQDKKGRTALMLEVSEFPRATEPIKFLLTQKPHINLQDANGKTALMTAIYWNIDIDAVRLMLENGAALELQDKDGWTAFIYAAAKTEKPEYLQLLLARGANVHHQTSAGETALSIAVAKSNAKAGMLDDPKRTLYYLRNAGLKPAPNEQLIMAVQSGDTATARKLLARGLSPNFRGKDTRPLLSYAAANGHAETAEALIQAGAEINARDYNQSSALMNAYNTTVVELLIKHGANVNFQNRYEETALSYAIYVRKIEVISRLLAAGADPQPQKKNGGRLFSPKWLDPTIAKLLRDAGAKD